jgi:hypothetical protein
MDNGWPRTVLTGLCIVTCALLGLLASRFAVGARGVVAPALLDASAPVLASALVFVCLAVGAAFACAIARPINAAVALFCVGCGVAAFSMRGGTVADAVFQGGMFRWLGFETLAWSLFVASVAVMIFRVGGPLPDVPNPDPDQSFIAGLLRKRALVSLAAALAAPAVLAFMMVGASKGQAIGACTLAGVAAAFGARLIAAHEQPILLFAAPCIVVGVAQLMLAGPVMGSLDARFASGSLNPILCVMPADVAAGSLCGVAVGLGWSRGLVKRDADA